MRTEDGYIIHKCLNGEKEAFGFLVDKYRESIYSFAYFKLRNFHDAEDITQEVFLKAFRKLHTLKCWDNFLAWLYAITSNLCKNFLRSKFNRPDREFIADQSSEFFRYKSMNSYREESTHESLYEALDSLPEMHRQVLTLHYLGGMSCREIAQFLGTSPSNIKQRLSRARAKLKKEMLEMMSKTYDQHKLQPGFTFRIVEMVKQIKIQPAPRTSWLPFGLSAATGIVLTVLMFSPHLLLLTPLGTLLGSPLPSKTKVMEIGELPVDVLEISEITFLSSEQGDDDGGVAKLPNPQNAFAPPLAPPGEVGKWTRKIDMPTARTGLSTSVVNEKIYAIGGVSAGGKPPLSTVEEYDPATGRWTKKAGMPTARSQLSTSVVNGKIYAIGGWNAGGVALTPVEEYDPATDTWTKKANMPLPRCGFSTSVVNGKIYAIWGWNENLPIIPTVEEYDPAIDRWTRKADIPTTRSNLSTSAVDGKIYAIGGCVLIDDNNVIKALSTVEEYDPATDTWTQKADMPTARHSLSTAVVNGKIYAIGGMSGGPRLEILNSLSTVEEYDPAADKWTKKVSMPTARGGLSTSAVNGRIYAIGGHKGAMGFSTVEEYDIGFVPSRSVSPEGKLPTMWGRMKAKK